MLKLIGITKEYPLGNDEKAIALRGVDLEFRKKEFVSILGHSGCGKTTLLNIIGGLDRYTTGDLIIDGVSTKQYKDRDWDVYRNHRIGFVFQTYNLIMHLTVIENVELALTLVGIDRKERHERARQALASVGLRGEENKRPNQLSGGQMQRVAIARAIINNPDILLADEPTGALDSDTSVQIMDILAQLSKDKLVIMVTHNPELAERYSTRIVRVTDGKVVGDTNPYTAEDAAQEAQDVAKAQEENAAVKEATPESAANAEKKPRRKKSRAHTSMSYKSALMLSGKNLLTKRARTTLTSIAGSIGIIGIAIVLALSAGFSGYVNTTAENALSRYPLTITGSAIDMTSLVTIFMGNALSDGDFDAYPEDGTVSFNPILSTILDPENLDNILGKNDVSGLKKYLDANFDSSLGTVKYDYDLTMHMYTDFAQYEGGDLHYYKINPYAARVVGQLGAVASSTSDSSKAAMLGGLDAESVNSLLQQYSGMFNVWDELSTNQELLDSQYELIGGRWPQNYDELVLVVDKYNHIDDYMSFALGLTDPNNAGPVVLSGMGLGENPLSKWSYTADDLIEKLHYQLLLETSYYTFNQETGKWSFADYIDINDDGSQAIRDLVEPTRDGEVNQSYRALELKVTGVIRMREGVSAGSINGNIAYTNALIQYMMASAQKSDLLFAQRAFSETFSGQYQSGKVDKINYYLFNMPEKIKGNAVVTAWYDKDQYPIGSIEYYYADVEGADPTYHEEPRYLPADGYTKEDLIFLLKSGTGIREERKWEGSAYSDTNTNANKLNPAKDQLKCFKLATSGDDARYYAFSTAKTVGQVSREEYLSWLHTLGYAVESQPASISIYASSFANKEKIVSLLDGFAETEGGSDLHYSDTVGALMSGITLIIQAITYVLIAFSSISLIVSSIMIAIITYTSVMERTKEIGILRSIGARKRDITRVFNSETFIIGLMSGLIASLVTWLLSIPVNAILYSYTKIKNLAVVTWWHPVMLVGLSVTLTAIAGFIPARIAAHKDPVLALRSE